MKSGNILVVDDEKVIRDGCQDILRKDYYVECIETGQKAINALAKNLFHIVLLDLKLPDIDGMQVLEKIKKENPHVEVIVITAYATIESAVEAVKKGADDYISKPFTPEELRLSVQKALRKKSLELENVYLKERIGKRDEPVITVGNSPKMKRIYELIRKVAPTDSTVLICGESGTGKELIAREIHRQSLRRDRPFLAIDCGALVETLLESELFGHIKGSFTDAYSTKHGSFELANGGTFFFDEVANLSPGIQAKLLRAIQEREIRPVGGEKPIRIDVRIISATNKDLKEEIEKDNFRKDLFYRISVIVLSLPPLRERKEDIPLLANHFLKKYNQKRKRDIRGISSTAMKILLSYHWPGNVRELENAIERAVIIEDSDVILSSSLPPNLFSPKVSKSKSDKPKTLEELEKEHILETLDRTSFHKTKAAKILGIDRKTLYKKIKKYGIS